MENKNTNMTIFAEALISNRDYKNARINGEAVGVTNARVWATAVKALRIPAYAIRVYRYNHMGDAEAVAPCDQSPLYTALKPVLDMVGVVNGAQLDAHNCAEEIISNALRFRVIDITPEMAHARAEKREAKKALDEDESADNQANYDHWEAEVKRLESEPGNCKHIPEIQSESAFVKAVEILLGDAITKQSLKSAEQVAAEEEAKKAERKAKAKARKKARNAKKSADKVESDSVQALPHELAV